MLKLFFKGLIFVSVLSSLAQANSDIVYQYPARPEDTPRLIEVTSLMGFIENTYGSKVSEKGVSLKWNFDWNQSYMGAGSSLYQGQFSILYFGGFSRVPESDFGVVALTLCHEVGHLLGGDPKQRLEDKINGDWSSAEGQSDWFAATECLPKVYQFFKKQISEKATSDKDAEKFCLKNEDQAQCEFIVRAGLGFAQINFKYFNTNLAALETVAPHISHSASEKPAVTLHSSYPSMQCRLDTYKQGALCADNAKACVRPQCWFNAAVLF